MRMARYARADPSSGVRTEELRCGLCGLTWGRVVMPGREPRWCSDRCKQRAYRDPDAAARGWEAERRRRERMRGRTGAEPGDGEHRRDRSGWAGDSAGGSREQWAKAGSRWRPPPRGTQMSVDQARVLVFQLAGLVDNGTTTVKSAYRAAARRVHPDVGGQVEAFQRLEQAMTVLAAAELL
jgi:hypothetical protein